MGFCSCRQKILDDTPPFVSTTGHRSGVKFFVAHEIFVARFPCFDKGPFVPEEPGTATSTLLFSSLTVIGNILLLIKRTR